MRGGSTYLWFFAHAQDAMRAHRDSVWKYKSRSCKKKHAMKAFSTMFSLILTVLSMASLCQAIVGHAIIPSSLTAENPFDGGALGSCEVPTNGTVCSIDYAVPTSIARLAAIIQQQIANEVNNLDPGSCRDAFRTVLCNVRFPRCEQLQGGSEYQQVTLNSQNCSVLSAACSEATVTLLLPFCDRLIQRVLPISGECRPVSEHAEAEEPLVYCTLEEFGRNRVTPWMFEYIRYTDQVAGGLLYDSQKCGVHFATFMCNFGGRCSIDGERIELVNTHESCNEIVECYGHDHQSLASSAALCQLWPQEHLNNTMTSPVDNIPVDTTTEVILTARPRTGNNLVETDFAVNSADTYSLKQSILWVFLLALLL